MRQTPLRILLATGTRDALVERIEQSLMRELAAMRADLLLLTEGRQGGGAGPPAIDLEECPDPGRVDPVTCDHILTELGRIVDDTRWYAESAGLLNDSTSVEAKLIATTITVDEVLNHYRPQIVLTWNGLLGGRAVVANRARRLGIPVLYCERGQFPGTWYADSHGVNGLSSLVVCPPAALSEERSSRLSELERAEILADLDRLARSGASAWEQAGLRGAEHWKTELALDGNRRVLFFPLQVDSDTNMRFFSPHFGGSLAALQAVTDAVRGRPGWFLLVKPHPKGDYPPGSVEQIVGDMGRCVKDINLHDALALCTLVVTINSTVAAEAAWKGKPVLQLGSGILSGKHIVAEFDPHQALADQLDAAVDAWHAEPDRRDRALRLYDYLKREYLLDADKDSDTARLIKRMTALTLICPGSGPATTARALADRHTWEPARHVLAALVDRSPGPSRVVLVGYGRNARRLLATAARHGSTHVQWLAWDDDCDARARAVADGITLFDGAAEPSGCKTFFVVTPRNSADLAQALEARGLRSGRDYCCLFSPISAQAGAATYGTTPA